VEFYDFVWSDAMARKKAIKQYKGKLSPEKVAAGMNAAARNAKRLLDDANLLFASKRYPGACSLAILAIEEAGKLSQSGKLSQLRGIAIAPDERLLKDAWRDYRDHLAKNAHWIIIQLVAQGARTLDDLHPIVDKDSDHPAVLDSVKQIAFYTDCCGNAHWSEPNAVIDEQLAKMIITIAGVLCPKHQTTTREIELWIEHVGSVWGTPDMFARVVEFHRAMQRENLGNHTPEEIEAFFGLTTRKPASH
jgi:AbiV family abortive infection protein